MSTALTQFAGTSTLIEFRPAFIIVDDEEMVCTAVRRVFQRHDVTVHAAHSAVEGLEMLSTLGQGGVQVVISDFQLPPGHDGAWFLTRVRERWPRLQRVLMTAGGRVNVDDLGRAINEGGVHRFLSKPWSNDQFVATVNDCIDQWRVLAERDRLLELLAETNRDLEDKVRHRTRDLEHASQVWRRTFDAIEKPMTLVDGDFRIVRANVAAAQTAKLDVRDLIGRHCHESLFGRSTPCEGCPIKNGADAAGQLVELTDERAGLLWQMASWPLLADVRPEKDHPDARVTVCHYEDITEARERERQMIMLEKIAAVGELAGCVAHELNNPLTGILGFGQVLARTTVGRDPDVHGMAVEIEEAARRCRNIVQALLDYARPDGQVKFNDVPVRSLVEGCVRVATLANSPARGVEVVRQYAPNLFDIRGSEDGLKSMVLNLINNAAQAMDRMGRIEIVAENVPGEHAVCLTFTDNGPGIPDAIKEKVFKPFFTTKAENKSGTGLGLAIVRNAVRDHGGMVHLTDAPGGGARFTIHLPAAVTKDVQ